MRKGMTLSDVVTKVERGDFTLRYCQFLDDFKDTKDKEAFLAEEPPVSEHVTPEEYALLASAVHFLANREGISAPPWVMSDKYFLDHPMYPYQLDSEDFREFMKETTAPEFAMRNLMYGAGVCSRV